MNTGRRARSRRRQTREKVYENEKVQKDQHSSCGQQKGSQEEHVLLVSLLLIRNNLSRWKEGMSKICEAGSKADAVLVVLGTVMASCSPLALMMATRTDDNKYRVDGRRTVLTVKGKSGMSKHLTLLYENNCISCSTISISVSSELDPLRCIACYLYDLCRYSSRLYRNRLDGS